MGLRYVNNKRKRKYLEKIIVSGSIAANQALIDSTTINAFINPVGLDWSSYRNGKFSVRLFNTSGVLQAEAWISGTAPGGEALGSELLTGWTNSGYETFTSAGANITSAINTTGDGQCDSNVLTAPAGSLLKLAANITLNSGSIPNYWFPNSSTFWKPPAAGAETSYITAISANPMFVHYRSGVRDYSATNSMKILTDCAATGALLLSSKNGSRGWSYKVADGSWLNGALNYQIIYNP